MATLEKSEQCAVAVFETFSAASAAVHQLDQSIFPNDQVSLITREVTEETPGAEAIQFSRGTPKDIATGAGVGGLLSMLLAAPMLAIPGVGVIFAAGPLAAGLAGGVVGGFLGGMLGWGVKEDYIAEYEELVQDGAVLVVAQGNPRDVATALEVLNQSDAQNVNLHSRTSDDDVDP